MTEHKFSRLEKAAIGAAAAGVALKSSIPVGKTIFRYFPGDTNSDAQLYGILFGATVLTLATVGATGVATGYLIKKGINYMHNRRAQGEIK